MHLLHCYFTKSLTDMKKDMEEGKMDLHFQTNFVISKKVTESIFNKSSNYFMTFFISSVFLLCRSIIMRMLSRLLLALFYELKIAVEIISIQ